MRTNDFIDNVINCSRETYVIIADVEDLCDICVFVCVCVYVQQAG